MYRFVARSPWTFLTVVGIVPLLFGVCSSCFGGEPAKTRSVRLKKIQTVEHSTNAYCQGLFFERDSQTGEEILYESCGKYGKSRVRIIDAATGKEKKKRSLDKRFFAEGLTVADQDLYLLTWREGVGSIRDKTTLKEKQTFLLPTEGWGITEEPSDAPGQTLIVSDGTAVLRWYDSRSFAPQSPPREIKTLTVFYRDQEGQQRPVPYLNELEWIHGEIWANIYQSTRIARIDPQTGEVIQFLNCTSLIPEGYENETDRVLNGIAWDKEKDRIFITGKDWPVLYIFQIVPSDPSSQK